MILNGDLNKLNIRGKVYLYFVHLLLNRPGVAGVLIPEQLQVDPNCDEDYYQAGKADGLRKRHTCYYSSFIHGFVLL